MSRREPEKAMNQQTPNYHQFWIDLLTHEMNGGKVEEFDTRLGWVPSKLLDTNGQVNFRTLPRWRKQPEPRVIWEHRGKDGYLCCRSGACLSDYAVKSHCANHGGTLHRYVEDLEWKGDV